ncbi:MAG: sulfurtransferase TusA family protein [Pseudodesulfovibrio sp.]
MSEIIDERGLSCPQPVLDTLAKIAAMGSGELEVLVDTEASKENVARAAQNKGWRVESITEDGGEFRLKLIGG